MTQNEHIYIYGGAAMAAGIVLIVALQHSRASQKSAAQSQPSASDDPMMPMANTVDFGAAFWPDDSGWASAGGGPVAGGISAYDSTLGEPVENWGLPAVLPAPGAPSIPAPITAAPSDCCDDCEGMYANMAAITQNVNMQNALNEMYAIAGNGGY